MAGLRDCEVEWVFDKGRLYGRAGAPQHLAFIISAAYRSAPRPNAELAAIAEAALRRYFPAMAGASRHAHARAARGGGDVLLRSRLGGDPARPGDADPRALPRRRLDRHRAARDHRGRRAQRPARRARVDGVSAAPRSRALRWAGLAWLAVWVPAYWAFYGPMVFLNLCDIAVILTCVGLWRGSALLLSTQAVSSLVVDARVGARPGLARGDRAAISSAAPSTCGTPPIRGWLRALSLFHVLLPVTLLYGAAPGGVRPPRAWPCSRAGGRRPRRVARHRAGGERQLRVHRSVLRPRRGGRRPSTWR